MSGVDAIVVGQGGGSTAVINETLAGAIHEARERKVRKILGVRNGLEGLIEGDFVDLTNFDIEIIRGSRGAYLGTTRINEEDVDMGVVKGNLSGVRADGLIFFGGQDTAKVLATIGRLGIPCVHGAKTIDNDLEESHHTPGFGSATLYNAKNVRFMTQDAFSYGSLNLGVLVIYQVMGRNTGWLAQGCAFARYDSQGRVIEGATPDIIWPAERDFDEIEFADAVRDVFDKRKKMSGRRMAFVVVSEGVSKEVDGKRVSLASLTGNVVRDPHGNEQYGLFGAGSAAEYFVIAAREGFRDKLKIIPVIAGYPQRSYEKSGVDAEEAFELGRETLRADAEGDGGKSVVIQRGDDGGFFNARVPLDSVAGKTRYVGKEYWDGGIYGPNETFIREFSGVAGLEYGLG